MSEEDRAGDNVSRKFSPEEYSAAIAGTDLVAVTLMEFSFTVKPDFYDREIKRKLLHDREPIFIHYAPADEALVGRFAFAVEAKSGKRKLLKARMEYLVVYKATADLNAGAAEEFCRRVGIIAAYPYFRAMMSQLSWASNTQLPPLPTITANVKPSAPAKPEQGQRRLKKA